MAILVVTAGLFGLAHHARAGAKSSDPVYIDVANQMAYGSLQSARTSSDSSEWIYCAMWKYSSDPSPTAVCGASAGGNYASCVTSDPDFIKMIQMVNPASLIEFQADPSTGACNFVDVGNSSDDLP